MEVQFFADQIHAWRSLDGETHFLKTVLNLLFLAF